jgi:hypothetical protein
MTIKLRSRLLGAHVHATVFIGPDADHLASNGELVMDPRQWAGFNVLLGLGAKHSAGLFEFLPALLELDPVLWVMLDAAYSAAEDALATKEMPTHAQEDPQDPPPSEQPG